MAVKSLAWTCLCPAGRRWPAAVCHWRH